MKVKAYSLTLAGLLISGACFDAQAVITIGDRSCGNWIEGRNEKNVRDAVNTAWLMGYLTGLAVSSSKDILRQPDASSILIWVDNYCQKNPLDLLSAAGTTLFWELAKRNKQ